MATAPFTYRDGLGRPLTWPEADNNFRRVEELHDETEIAADAAILSASNAGTSETNAGQSASSASTSATNAGNAFSSFDERFLGAKPSDPALDNSGEPLIVGAMYWNSAANEMRVYTGSAWLATYLPAAGYVLKTGDTMTGALHGTEFGGEAGGLAQVVRSTLKDSATAYHNNAASYTLNFENGSHQRFAPTGDGTLSTTNWPPAGNLGELLIEGVNLGLRTINWLGISWVLSDGTISVDFNDTEVELQTAGVDWILLWSRDAGATKYGKVMR